MGNSYAGQLKTTRFEEVLHNSIEASLRSNNLVPRPIFSQLYLEAEQQLSSLEGGVDNDDDEEDDDVSGSSSPAHSYLNKPPPEGCCTTDGFCQAGKDLRLASIASEQFEVPPGFLLVGAKSPSLPDHILVCAVDKRFLPDDNGRNALLGFSGNCVGCGEKGFRYFTEFSNHINLKLTTQPKKQKHLKYYLIRNVQGCLTKGSLISWKGTEVRSRHSSSGMCSSTGIAPLDSSVLSKMSDPSIHVTNGSPLAGENGFPPVQNGTSYQNMNGTCQQPARVNPSTQTRPAVLGNVTNSGPPKKRHKGWSPESPSSTDNSYHNTSSYGKVDTIGQLCVPQSTTGNPLSSPLVTTGEPVPIPDNLLKTCMIRPVIFKGHGNFPYLCGNVNEVIVSPLLYNCYKNSQSMPKTYEQYGPTAIQPISEEMQLLLTVYYLVQLAPDQVPLIEDLEHILMRLWRETHLAEIRQYQQNMSQAFPHFPSLVTAVTASQLPWLAGLAASSCNESVKIIECSYSLAEGLTEMFKLLVEGKLEKTNYVVIICTSRPSIDSCIVITGKYQARTLIESMYSPADCLKEINYELTSGKVESLRAFFSSFCPDGDIDVLLDKYHHENHSLISSTPKKTSGESRPAACSSYNTEWHQLRPSQLAVAQKLLSHVCSIADSSTQNLDLGSFEKVDFLICVPPSEVTYQQTLSHVWSSGVLLELGLEKDQLTKQCMEQYVIKLDADAPRKFKSFLQKAMQNPHTLFVLVHDHAHWDLTSSLYNPYPQREASFGLVDRLLNCRELRDSANILLLHVTSCPYALQTQNTRISPYNEIHWPSSYSHGMELYHENRKYFGLSQYIDSTLSGHSLPLLRHDSSFEAIVLGLGKRFPKLHSAVIRTFLLIQHYSSAMMAICGLSQMKSYTSVETLEIVQNLLNSPKQCASGHGLMVLLRIPCIQLATLAHERLCHVRERLGLQNRFEVILGMANSAITIGKHFVDQLKVWQKNEEEDWQPRTYLALEGLPCILICSGTEPLGESLPRSLRYCDLRLVQFYNWERTVIEQELGFASCFLNSDASQDKGLGRDVLDSDPEKLSSTDNEDEEMGIDGSNSEKRSPSKRQRSPSDDSASSSLCSKASGSVVCNESSYSTMADDSTKPTQQSRVSNSEDCTTEKLNVLSDNNVKKHSVVTSEQPDSNSLSHTMKSTPGSASTPSSTSSSCFQSGPGLQISQCAMAKAYKQLPVVFLPKLVYDIITSTDSSGLSKASSFLPRCDVSWASSYRPLLSKTMTCTEQSLYYRQWTVPKPSHMDYYNVNEGRMDTFHPRRLLLSGPPQVGKTGAYLQFLSVLSRMLIRLTEVDVYDEEEINGNLKSKPDQPFHQTQDMWPNVDSVMKMDFDYILHDPKYEDASVICPKVQNFNQEDKPTNRRHDDIYVRRPTTRMRLSKYASYNTYHHCEQCHQYMGYNPRFQMYESTLHAFAFSYSMLGEEIQLHFIIPKSKEHHFVFSQPGGQLESMRLPLISGKSSDSVKSPIFTPTTGRHEHGLFNLYHAMDGSSHLHILVVKEYEMAIYKKYWPNHIMLVLPSIFNSAGVGAAHFLIKELSYHNLELERNRQAELGVPHQDVWPFIAIADDSCVMWNSVDVNVTGDHPRDFSWHERNVSLKHILQHMEATQNIAQYAMLGMRKWTSKTKSIDMMDPFSRCHLHDFILLNVDLTRDVQYNQNRFTCDDVDFNLRVNSSGLLMCRFNRFSVMKKQIAVGGHRSLHIKPKVLASSLSVSSAHYICAPDSKHTILAAPAQLLLEKFLQFHSQRFFPLSVNNRSHPVLVVDCYLNLGPQISVCYVSSRPHSVNISCPDMAFSGLLLHLCDSFVVASFLKKFQFLKDATLCVVCQDRNALRQTVVRLELEDEWQFRLRDEFQTANAKEDKPLFILTGRHV